MTMEFYTSLLNWPVDVFWFLSPLYLPGFPQQKLAVLGGTFNSIFFKDILHCNPEDVTK